MKYLRFILLLNMIGICTSCNNDEGNISQTLSGIYSETSPEIGRSRPNFVNENTIIKTEVNSSSEDIFTYELNGNVILLTPTWVNTTSQKFEIEIINSSKFKIENLYPSVGINPTTYMTFQK